MSIDLGRVAVLTTDPEEADNGRGEPKNGGEEGESNDGLELSASVTARSDVGPVPETTADLGSNELVEFPV